MSARFLNIDVEVRDTADPTALRTAFGADISVLHVGTDADGLFLFTFEAILADTDDPAVVAEALCTVIEGLDAPARAHWHAVRDRVFDLGYEAELTGPVSSPVFSPSLLRRLADLDVRLAISIYVPQLRPDSAPDLLAPGANC
ncbi:hypothetical protein [Nocardia sp. NPDC005978]|uniref:hypothetical protein n=1 Tax=unclassified Nocardia TaxID=2637762 RepID=UPI0033A60655